MTDSTIPIQLDGLERPLILALDIGSSSARAALVDGTGKRVPGSLIHSGYQQDTISSEHGSLDPVELISVVEALVDQVLATISGSQAEIVAVGISTFWHSVMGIDAEDKPCTRVLMWSDVRASSQCHAFESALDPGDYRRRTGTPIHSSYPALKLLWLRNEDPGQFSRARRWLSFGEYLLHTWCGADNVSVSMASATGMFDQTRLEWDGPTLQVLGIEPGLLSRVSDEPAEALRPAYVKRWPALEHAKWFPALGDGACANVGSGAIGRVRIALSVGTSGAMRMLWEGDPVNPPDGLWLYRLDDRRVLLGGALSEGGNLWKWISQRLTLPDESQLTEAIAAIPPDSHGLTWLPFLAGERSVGWSPDAHGVISGLTLHTTSVQILRAGLEAIAYRFGLIADRMNDFVAENHVVIGSGNALVNDRNWPQIVCDVIGNELIESPEPEASLRGAALVALERLGAIADLDATSGAMLDGATRFTPDNERHAIYLKGQARQQELYRRLLG